MVEEYTDLASFYECYFQWVEHYIEKHGEAIDLEMASPRQN